MAVRTLGHLGGQDEHDEVDDPFEGERGEIEAHERLVRLELVRFVHSRDHLLDLEKREQVHSRDEKEKNVDAHSPDERPREGSDDEPRCRHRREGQVGQPAEYHSTFAVALEPVFTVALLEKLDCDWHGQACHHDLLDEEPVV